MVNGGLYLLSLAWLRSGLPPAHATLGIETTAARAGLMAICVAILFCYFSQPGFYVGNAVSLLISATSWLVVPGPLVICWPSQVWVKDRVTLQARRG